MKKLFRFLCYLLAVIALLVVIFLIYIHVDTGLVKELSHLEEDLDGLVPGSVKVEGVPLYTQPDPYSCGPTTISVLVSYCTDQDMAPQALIDKYALPGGMTSERFVEILSGELPEYRVVYRHDQGDLELIKMIHEQLCRGLPVPVFFGAANPHNEPYYDFHASLVTGIDLENRRVDILNVYGYEEQIGLVEFLNRMSYRPTRSYPFMQRLALKLGFIDRNSVFLLVEE